MISKEQLYDYGIEYKGRWLTEIKAICPKCSHTRKKKKEPCLSVNTEDGMFICHHCEWSGVIKEKKMREVSYVKPKYNKTKLSDKVLSYFKGRCISQKTILRNNITEEKVYMPQVQGDRNAIRFNYFRDGECVNVKFRDSEKNFKQVAGAEKVFYGLDDIKDVSDIIIVEGEFDKLSFDEIGLTNCVSVPDGAPNANAKNVEAKFSYLDNCYSYFESKERIYIAVDNDANGRRLLEELSRRLGRDRVWIIDFPDGCKDANDVLRTHGQEKLYDCYEGARAYPVEGVFGLDNVEEMLWDSYYNGKEKGATTGYNLINGHYSLRVSEFDVFTGIPGHGKSSFCFQIMLNSSILYGWKWAVFSPENYPINELYETLIEMYIGASSDIDSHKRMNVNEYDSGMRFVSKHFFAVYPEDNFSLDNVLDKFQYLVRTKGVKGVLIDPYNQLDHDYTGVSEANHVANTLNKIRRFTKANDVKFMVVAHPITMRSTDGRGNVIDNEVPTAYRISGGANWFNKADNIITIHRPNPKDFHDTTSNIHVQKIKFQKLVGVPTGTPISLTYHRPSGRFLEGGEYPLDALVNKIDSERLPY
ncbi:toprim domain-containing protein [bacterium]|nr:toprim domain-containing protein [bacterium]